MSDDEIIAVVQAHKEGKKIEVQPKAQDSGYRYDWLPLIQPKWNFEKCDFRVAPEPRKPREWDVVVHSNGQIESYEHPQFSGSTIRVREVLP